MRRQLDAGNNPFGLPFEGKAVAVSAKIDFITFTVPTNITTTQHNFIKALAKGQQESRLEIPRPSWGHPILATLHDPTKKELFDLASAIPRGEVHCIEIAVDFKPCSSVDRDVVNQQVYQYLRHGLMPNKLPVFRTAVRKYFDTSQKKTKPDALGTDRSDGTLYWGKKADAFRGRMYLKVKDHGVDIPYPHVRIELTMHRGGAQKSNLASLAAFGTFFSVLRKRLGDGFYVARAAKFTPRKRVTGSAKPLTPRGKKEFNRLAKGFSRYGAMWCAKNGVATSPDRVVNKRIGDALHKLANGYCKLKLSAKKKRQLKKTELQKIDLYQLDSWFTTPAL